MIQVVWVEIPVQNIERALKFYQAVFGLDAIEIMDDGVRRTATLYGDPTGARPGISLNQTANFECSDKGTFIYLDSSEELSAPLQRVIPAGGQIVTPKTSMGADGYFASIQDTEGNVVALYSAT